MRDAEQEVYCFSLTTAGEVSGERGGGGFHIKEKMKVNTEVVSWKQY